jgi:hypothetical protein
MYKLGMVAYAVISVLRKLRQTDCEFEANLEYISCIVRPYLKYIYMYVYISIKAN